MIIYEFYWKYDTFKMNKNQYKLSMHNQLVVCLSQMTDCKLFLPTCEDKEPIYLCFKLFLCEPI